MRAIMSVLWEVRILSRLLYAEWKRLWNSLIFHLGMIFSVGLAVFIVVLRWMDVRKNPQYYAQFDVDYVSVDGVLFIGVMYLIFAFAVFVPVFVGTEYSNGTIRNKLIAGKSRGQIYFSELLVCVTANLLMFFLYLAVMLGLGGFLLGIEVLKPVDILKYTLIDLAAIMSFTALLVAITTITANKATAAIACFLTTFVLLLGGITIFQNLSAPEFYELDSIQKELAGENAELQREQNPNPHYIRGTKRKVYTFLNEFLPVSQLFQVGMESVDYAGKLAAYDGLLLILVTGAGVYVLERKNIK